MELVKLRLAPRSKAANLGTRQKSWEFPGAFAISAGGGGKAPAKLSREKPELPRFPRPEPPANGPHEIPDGGGRHGGRVVERSAANLPTARWQQQGTHGISRGYTPPRQLSTIRPITRVRPPDARARSGRHEPGGLRRASAPGSSSSPNGTGHPRPGDEHPANLPRRGEPTETGSPRGPKSRPDWVGRATSCGISFVSTKGYDPVPVIVDNRALYGHSRAIFVNNRRIFRLTGRSVDQRLPTMSRLGRFAGYPSASNRVPCSDQRLGIGVRISCSSHWPYRYASRFTRNRCNS